MLISSTVCSNHPAPQTALRADESHRLIGSYVRVLDACKRTVGEENAAGGGCLVEGVPEPRLEVETSDAETDTGADPRAEAEDAELRDHGTCLQGGVVELGRGPRQARSVTRADTRPNEDEPSPDV